MNRIEGRVAVVTGAASGIGFALAAAFAAAGACVVLADVERRPLDAAVDHLRAGGYPVLGVRTDVRDSGDLRQLSAATIREFGAVHVLCNNAGVESGALFTDIPLPTWEWVMAVDFWGLRPEAVAGQVLDAVRAGRFFVLPHPAAALAAADRRLRRMTDAQPAESAG
jgi:NAD(P)-dependent dehydrogenase (short-subunit alcohol dehydrogenase family)